MSKTKRVGQFDKYPTDPRNWIGKQAMADAKASNDWWEFDTQIIFFKRGEHHADA